VRETRERREREREVFQHLKTISLRERVRTSSSSSSLLEKKEKIS